MSLSNLRPLLHSPTTELPAVSSQHQMSLSQTLPFFLPYGGLQALLTKPAVLAKLTWISLWHLVPNGAEELDLQTNAQSNPPRAAINAAPMSKGPCSQAKAPPQSDNHPSNSSPAPFFPPSARRPPAGPSLHRAPEGGKAARGAARQHPPGSDAGHFQVTRVTSWLGRAEEAARWRPAAGPPPPAGAAEEAAAPAPPHRHPLVPRAARPCRRGGAAGLHRADRPAAGRRHGGRRLERERGRGGAEAAGAGEEAGEAERAASQSPRRSARRPRQPQAPPRRRGLPFAPRRRLSVRRPLPQPQGRGAAAAPRGTRRRRERRPAGRRGASPARRAGAPGVLRGGRGQLVRTRGRRGAARGPASARGPQPGVARGGLALRRGLRGFRAWQLPRRGPQPHAFVRPRWRLDIRNRLRLCCGCSVPYWGGAEAFCEAAQNRPTAAAVLL